MVWVHNKGMNVLFTDGHVSWVAKTDRIFCGASPAIPYWSGSR
jgi:prepilin-type processing-associated H-X9-DG protein